MKKAIRYLRFSQLEQSNGSIERVLSNPVYAGLLKLDAYKQYPDGRLTSFLVDYPEQPPALNLSLSGTGKQFVSSIFSEIINQEQVEHHAAEALASIEKMRGIKDKKYGILLRLNGLFIHDNIMLLRLHIANETNIDYDIDQLRLYIRDLKKSKRTATQEIEMSPLFVSDSTRKITGQSGKTIVMAVPKFTIPDKKYLALQLMEKNGGRHLEVHIKNKKIVKAAQID